MLKSKSVVLPYFQWTVWAIIILLHTVTISLNMPKKICYLLPMRRPLNNLCQLYQGSFHSFPTLSDHQLGSQPKDFPQIKMEGMVLGLSQAEKDTLDKLFISEEQCILPQVSQLDGFEKGKSWDAAFWATRIFIWFWTRLRSCSKNMRVLQLIQWRPLSKTRWNSSGTISISRKTFSNQSKCFAMEGLPFLVCTLDYTAVHREKRHFEHIIEAFPVYDESLFPEKLPRSVRKKVNTSFVIWSNALPCLIDRINALLCICVCHRLSQDW